MLHNPGARVAGGAFRLAPGATKGASRSSLAYAKPQRSRPLTLAETNVSKSAATRRARFGVVCSPETEGTLTLKIQSLPGNHGGCKLGLPISYSA